MAPAISINDRDVLLAIDLQADFMPGGALAVEAGDEVVPLINRLASRFDARRHHPGLASADARLFRG